MFAVILVVHAIGRRRVVDDVVDDLTRRLQVGLVGIADLDAKVRDLREAIKFFESKLPQEREFDKILKEVSQMAETNALQTKTVRTLKSERCAGYSAKARHRSSSASAARRSRQPDLPG